MATEGSEMRWQLAGGSGSRCRARMHASSFISRMHASPGRRVITLVRPWPPWREAIACLCLFHGLFRIIRNGVCQSLISSSGSTVALYYR